VIILAQHCLATLIHRFNLTPLSKDIRATNFLFEAELAPLFVRLRNRDHAFFTVDRHRRV
jgi:hypothetical protein